MIVVISNKLTNNLADLVTSGLGPVVQQIVVISFLGWGFMVHLFIGLLSLETFSHTPVTQSSTTSVKNSWQRYALCTQFTVRLLCFLCFGSTRVASTANTFIRLASGHCPLQIYVHK